MPYLYSLIFLIFNAYCAIIVCGAPLDMGSSKNELNTALQIIGNKTCPHLKSLDFGYMFGQDLSPEQTIAVRKYAANTNIVSQSVARIDSDIQYVDETKKEGSSVARPLVRAKNLEHIKYIAIYASISYTESVESIKNWSCGPSPRVSKTFVAQIFEQDSSFGYIAVRPCSKEIIVAFRGTADIQNWIADFDFVHVDWPFPLSKKHGNVRVHSGFIGIYQAIRKKIRSTVHNLAKKHPEYTVVVTGHSMGAAQATIAALDLIGNNELNANRIDLMVFASPRVGNSEFSKLVSNVGFRFVHRYVHENDIVSHCPIKLFGYEHIEGELYSQFGTVHVCKGAEDSLCSNSRVPFLTFDVHTHFLNATDFFTGYDRV